MGACTKNPIVIFKEKKNFEELKKRINRLPKVLELLIYTYTDEFSRRYARHLGFNKFGAPNNTIFPRYFLRYLPFYKEEQELKILEKEKIRRKCIKNKKIYTTGGELPMLTYSYEKEKRYPDTLPPTVKSLEINIFSNYEKLLLNCLKVTSEGLFVFLLVPPSFISIVQSYMTILLQEHQMGDYHDKYIVYYEKSNKKFKKKVTSDVIPKILCIPYNYNKLKNIENYIEILNVNKISNYLVYPYDINPQFKLITKSYNARVTGSISYSIIP